ncbi:TetR/AcrR family transcriptional regulator [Actinosynnema sp. NPDC023658]|uniref:TetR/AcrR family transcriptional regulator n=1 Tax=Actinosynnema sp. NPDC023658 TaxID=3155465 RepID=UPI0033C6EC2B
MTTVGTRGTGAAAPRGVPAKRRAIMDAALDVFLREGYSRANVDVIATEAGVSKQTVYNHFGDKERLFNAVMEAARADADAGAVVDDTLLRRPARLKGDLVKVGRQLLGVLLDPKVSAVRRLLIAEAAHHPELNQPCEGGDHGGGLPTLVQWLTVRVACLAAQGDLEVPDPDRAASQFVALLAFEGLQSSQYGLIPLTKERVDSISRSAADMFTRAYLARRAGGASAPEPVRLVLAEN